MKLKRPFLFASNAYLRVDWLGNQTIQFSCYLRSQVQ
jgi:hypothetical protein